MARSPRTSLFLLALAGGCLCACDCGGPPLVEVPPEKPRTDALCQIKASSIDILFVVDNSRSMVEEQQALAENFAEFLALVDPVPADRGEPGEVDYRIAVTSTDAVGNAGALLGQPQVIRPGAGYNPLEAFQTNVQVGTEGRALEQGLAAARLALQKSAEVTDGNGERAFLRDGAYLYIIIVSDEEDGSTGEVHFYFRTFEQVKGVGNENTVAVSAIAGPVAGGCPDATPGERYAEIAQLTGGLLGDICTTDWAATLRELAVTGIGLRKRFQLPVPPEDHDASDTFDFADMIVQIRYPCTTPHLDEYLAQCQDVAGSCADGDPEVVCTPYYGHPDGWIFELAETALVFDGAAVPGPGSCVDVTYFERDK